MGTHGGTRAYDRTNQCKREFGVASVLPAAVVMGILARMYRQIYQLHNKTKTIKTHFTTHVLWQVIKFIQICTV